MNIEQIANKKYPVVMKQCYYAIDGFTGTIDINKHDREVYLQGLQDGYNADKWIPVTEGLPELKQRVLVWCKEGHLILEGAWTATYLGSRIFSLSNHNDNITHWQPLQKPHIYDNDKKD